jgi:hypothetical protein
MSDTIVTHCVCDLPALNTVTIGGEATDNEMCFNFLWYSPQTKVQVTLAVSGDLFAGSGLSVTAGAYFEFVLTAQFSQSAISCVSWGVKKYRMHYSRVSG